MLAKFICPIMQMISMRECIYFLSKCCSLIHPASNFDGSEILKFCYFEIELPLSILT